MAVFKGPNWAEVMSEDATARMFKKVLKDARKKPPEVRIKTLMGRKNAP